MTMKEIIKATLYSSIVIAIIISAFYLTEDYLAERQHQETMQYLNEVKDGMDKKIEMLKLIQKDLKQLGD